MTQAARRRVPESQDQQSIRTSGRALLVLAACVAVVVTLVVVWANPSPGGADRAAVIVTVGAQERCTVQPDTLTEGVRHVTIRGDSRGSDVQILAESGELVYRSDPTRATPRGQDDQPRQAMARFTAGRYTVQCRTSNSFVSSVLLVVSDN